jgi:hypothetical protein
MIEGSNGQVSARKRISRVTVVVLLYAATSSTAPLPLRFESNLGQTDAEVRFIARARGYTMFLTPQGATFRVEAASKEGAYSVLDMRLAGANAQSELVGLDLSRSRSHYIKGGDSHHWVTNVPHYESVASRDVMPGIDLVYRASGDRVEFDVIVQPGAHPDAVELAFEGADSVALDEDGGVLLRMDAASLRMHPPRVFQSVQGVPRELLASYRLTEDERVSVHVEDYDPRHPLTIDPVLSYSTFVGGSGDDSGRAIAVDASGCAYLAGASKSLDFPAGSGFSRGTDAYLAKLDADGTDLEYVLFIGGSDNDLGQGVALDASGNAFLSGETRSSDFPSVNALQDDLGGDSDAFVAKINPSGTALFYSTYLGGTGFDSARGIAVDPSGNAFVMGQTLSVDFPTKNAFQPQHAGAIDAFIAQIDPSGTTLVFSTYLGGTGNDLPFHLVPGEPGDSPGWEIDVDASGFAYAAGTTESPDFPTVNALRNSHGGGLRDGFVSKIAPGGSALVYSTYIGGTGGDSARGVAADDFGNAYVTGGTRSDDFPVTAGAFQTVKDVLYDAFVLKLDPLGSLRYSTFVGGDASDGGNDISIDAKGSAFVVGHTSSASFPLRHPIQATFGGGAFDLFVLKLNPAGSELVFSTYLGGSDVDTPDNWNMGLALDGIGSVYVAGSTASTDFPITPGRAIQEVHAGGFDAVVSKLRTEPEIELSLSPDGGGNRLVLRLRHPGVTPREVELKFWIRSAVLGDAPLSLVKPPLLFELGPTDWVSVADAPLPASLVFPGTTIGVLLLDPPTGTALSESVCVVSPCN